MNRKLFSVISIALVAGALIIPVTATTNLGAVSASPSHSMAPAAVSPFETYVQLPATGTLTYLGLVDATGKYRYRVSITATNNTGELIFADSTILWSVVGVASGQMTLGFGDPDFIGVMAGDSFSVVSQKIVFADAEIGASGIFKVWLQIPPSTVFLPAKVKITGTFPFPPNKVITNFTITATNTTGHVLFPYITTLKWSFANFSGQEVLDVTVLNGQSFTVYKGAVVTDAPIPANSPVTVSIVN
jgi:hypothetical protein